MIKKLNLDDDAPWKERYRAPSVAASQIADLSPESGIVAHNRSGTLQWYAWDVPSGEMRQLTDTPGGHVAYLTISPDGKWVYYLDDEGGNEIGHYVRMSIESGEIQDITPDLPKYSSWGFRISRSGKRIGIHAAYDDKFHIFCLDVDEDGALGNLREIYTGDHLLMGILLSEDGSLISFMSTERSGKNQFSLLSYDTNTGERVAELWDGEDNSIVMMPSSPLAGDPHLLARNFFREFSELNRNGARADTSPIKLGGAENGLWKAAPSLGKDNDYVFGELLGLTLQEIELYIEKGVIA